MFAFSESSSSGSRGSDTKSKWSLIASDHESVRINTGVYGLNISGFVDMFICGSVNAALNTRGGVYSWTYVDRDSGRFSNGYLTGELVF